MANSSKGTVLIYSIHRTEDWFRYLGKNMGFAKSYVVSCLPDEGDYCVVNDFKLYEKQYFESNADHSELLTAKEILEISARCRVLRFMGKRRAASMALAMAKAFTSVLDDSKPDVIVSFPIDRYVSDVLEIVAKKRGIPFFELTVSALPSMSMLMQKGKLITREEDPEPEEIQKFIDVLAGPLFKPSYVQGVANFTQIRFLKTFLYFKLRGLTFWLISIWKKDRLNLHYLDSQSFLGHKPSLSDRSVTRLIEPDWREKAAAFEKSKRILFGLQLFPEASIDYWIDDLELIQHEELLLEAARAFSESGYIILVKDHPLQFGFRQLGLIRKMLQIPNVILVPYEANGTEALSICGVNFTCTGTLGLQAALIGIKSITAQNYYTTDEDFIIFENRKQIKNLPQMVAEFPEVTDLSARQRRIVMKQLQGGFPSEFFTFENFDINAPADGVAQFGQNIGKELRYHLDSAGLARQSKELAGE